MHVAITVAKYAIPSDQIKHEIPDNMVLKRPPYTEPYQHIRSPYEASPMLKYPPAPGAPIMPPGLPQDLKYTPPAVDMKYKPPENLSKSQFSADNLVKGYVEFKPVLGSFSKSILVNYK